MRPLDCRLEGEPIRFSQGIRIDDRVETVAVRFVVVEDVVFERRDHLLTLNAVYLFGTHDPAQVRILAVVLEVPAVAHVTREIDAAGQHDVEATATRLTPDRDATLARELWVETRSNGDRRREGGRSLVVRSVPGIGHAHAGVAAL